MDAGAAGGSDLILYQTEDGRTRVQCRFDGQTIWLTQAQMAELFQTTVPNISMHLKAIYEEGEHDEGATVQDYLTVRSEAGRKVSRNVRHYRLEAILAVGYRVRSALQLVEILELRASGFRYRQLRSRLRAAATMISRASGCQPAHLL